MVIWLFAEGFFFLIVCYIAYAIGEIPNEVHRIIAVVMLSTILAPWQRYMLSGMWKSCTGEDEERWTVGGNGGLWRPSPREAKTFTAAAIVKDLGEHFIEITEKEDR